MSHSLAGSVNAIENTFFKRIVRDQRLQTLTLDQVSRSAKATLMELNAPSATGAPRLVVVR